MAYASQPADLVYSLTKAMIVSYDAYKDAAPGAAGLALERQNFAWVIPYHEGAVKALKEAGAWKAEHEAHNQKLLKRQDTLAAAWADFLKGNPPDDKAAFTKALDGGAQGGADQGRPWTRCSNRPGAEHERRSPLTRHPESRCSSARQTGRRPRGSCRAGKPRRVEFADPHAQAGAGRGARSRACASSPASGAGC